MGVSILIGSQKYAKKSGFFQKKHPQNTPKTGFWLKTDLRIVTGVLFYVIWTKFGAKSSTEHLIHAKSVIFLEFLCVFSQSNFRQFSSWCFGLRSYLTASWSVLDRQIDPWLYRKFIEIVVGI